MAEDNPDISKPNAAMSRRDFLRGAVSAVGALVTAGPVGDAAVNLAQSIDNAKTAQQEIHPPPYSECEYSLEENFLRLETRLVSGEERNLDIPIIRKDLPILDSGYQPTEFEIVINDDLNPNFNCHSFALEQVTGIGELGAESNIWVDNPEMRSFLDMFGVPVFDTGNYNDDSFTPLAEVREGDLLALIDQDGSVIHTGVYHESFQNVDTSQAPYVCKFGSDKLMARDPEFVLRWYWANQPNETDTLKMVVFRFDESFRFSPSS